MQETEDSCPKSACPTRRLAEFGRNRY